MKVTDSSKTAALKKFARGLLTTTCLTAAAAGMAQATTVQETSVVGADFGNSFAARNDLGPGVTEVIGSIPFNDSDFFSISGLLGGGSYTISGVYGGFSTYNVLNSSQNPVNGGLVSNPATMTGTIPGDGILVVQAQGVEGGTYDLTLTAPTAPEPSTLGGVGLALAAGYALRRKLAK